MKKYDNARISDIEANCFTISGSNKFTSEILETKIKEKGSVDQCSIFNLVNNFDLTKNMQQYQQKEN